ncbi:formate--phosphoribosylaminoimidazolecarboxamide ligase [Candidatus Microgenomates bacterium]|nr:formate--phosphoribosylaminoimidazolecarboxamide ligase [Candidatus Microgenomates bacterium]
MKYTIATLASHSCLQILKGAKDEGFATIAITTPEFSSFYKNFPFIDELITIKKYVDFFKIEKKLLEKRVIIIPHGSFVAYLGLDENKKMKTSYFGNKDVLDWEADRKRQRDWLMQAGINIPRQFDLPAQINAPVMVKSNGAAGGRGYFFARNKKEFAEKIIHFTVRDYVIQEYIIGVPLFIHYFYSPLTGKLEILSIDRRYETNVDSLGRIPSQNQEGLGIQPSYVVVGNSPLTLRESLLPEAFAMGEKVVKTSQKIIPKKGLFGPFCLETIITPDQKFFVIEISCRIVAGTNLFIEGSPYTQFLYDEPMSTGRRIAREIKNAIGQNKLNLVLD